ncbi:MAG: PD40 domain-containing protein [Candidatus Latescibacteria bacterium]|nr:PD40 domain-containing protein [Candidatus Latescibacterota bacterium]
MLYARELVQSNLWSFKRRPSKGNRLAIPTQLTSGTSFDGSPHISPDGRWVAFAKGDRSPANIFLLPVEGGDERQLTFRKSMNACPAWSPSGDEVAFASDDGGAWRIWRASLHGAPAKVISRGGMAAAPGLSLVWAPGNRIVYQAPGGATLSVLDPGTGEERHLLTPDSIAKVLSPQWSPRGDRIAFLRWLDPSRAGIWVLSTADQSLARVYDGPPMYPIGWSSDARWIYAWDHGDREDRIVQIASDGSGQRVVMELPRKGNLLNPVITPDGSRVVASIITRQTDVWLVESFDRSSK